MHFIWFRFGELWVRDREMCAGARALLEETNIWRHTFAKDYKTFKWFCIVAVEMLDTNSLNRMFYFTYFISICHLRNVWFMDQLDIITKRHCCGKITEKETIFLPSFFPSSFSFSFILYFYFYWILRVKMICNKLHANRHSIDNPNAIEWKQFKRQIV